MLNFDQDALRENLEVFRHAEVAHGPVRVRHAFGTLAYTVSPAGAEALLDTCLPLARQFIRFEGFGIGIPNNGIDCMMNIAYREVKGLCVHAAFGGVGELAGHFDHVTSRSEPSVTALRFQLKHRMMIGLNLAPEIDALH